MGLPVGLAAARCSVVGTDCLAAAARGLMMLVGLLIMLDRVLIMRLRLLIMLLRLLIMC